MRPPREPGEASGTNTFPSATFSRHSLPQSSVFLMSSLSHSAMQQLHRLDRSSSGFHDELSSVLYGEEYQKYVPNLQGDDLVWFIEYLDKVRHRFALSNFPLKPS